MKFDRKTVALVLIAFTVGLYYAGGSWQPGPYIPVPTPAPQNDRPVLRFLARMAKTFLWVALVAEKAPQEPQPDHHVQVQARIGEDGYPVVDNARGW